MKLFEALRQRYETYLKNDAEKAKTQLKEVLEQYLKDLPQKDQLIHTLREGPDFNQQVNEIKKHLGQELQEIYMEEKSDQEVIDDLGRLKETPEKKELTPYEKAEKLLQKLFDILANQLQILNNLTSPYPDLPRSHLIRHLHESLWIEKDLVQQIEQLEQKERKKIDEVLTPIGRIN